ncbi:putative ATP-grasp-modified RiPP [Streptomyces sp. DSM 42041]|uniref:ATP-grasp-modified RiPP n=1 Tax=Streptomyces hazeniae TaxID=3075538 RepID=A0ABU2NN72_9ACTN|nr:putative ATP-grasp-modified RiPP [Streptomyces sp. DSM 42041]MDT0378403.1 putative ATP-grasp-modified RiPP [Streptomyces sp. DSM 42041]
MSARAGTLVPFGARVQHTPPVVTVETGTCQYDAARQYNVTPAGQPWSADPKMLASSTGTNWDSSPDETSDPYAVG